MKLPFKCVTICPFFTVVKNSALKLHVVIVPYPNFILGGVFILPFPPLMKTGGRKWRWALGLALRTTTSSSHSKSYHHWQAVYYFLAPHLLLSVTQFRAVEGNGNYATCIFLAKYCLPQFSDCSVLNFSSLIFNCLHPLTTYYPASEKRSRAKHAKSRAFKNINHIWIFFP